MSDLWAEDLTSGNVVRLGLGSIEVADLITHPRRLEAYVRSESGLVRVTPSGTQVLPACDRPGGLSLSVNGEYLAASCGPDGAREVVVFETTTWTIRHRVPTVTGYLDRLMLNANGSRGFVLEDGVAVYDVASGNRVLHGLDPPVPAGFGISSLDSGSPARDTLFVGAYQSFSLPDPAAADAPGVILERNLYYLVDAATLRITQTLPPAAKAFKTEVAPDGRHAFVASRGIYWAVIVQLIDLADNVELARRALSPADGLDIALAAAPLPPIALVASVSPERAVTLRWDLPCHGRAMGPRWGRV